MPTRNIAPNQNTIQTTQLYRERDITARGKFSKSHLYNMIARGEFPRQVINERRFARWGSEVDLWFADPLAWRRTHSSTETKGEAA
jgi:predicted DNA-binding transcriptional regulator AlpA